MQYRVDRPMILYSNLCKIFPQTRCCQYVYKQKVKFTFCKNQGNLKIQFFSPLSYNAV